ncbi:hypothetical protein KA047_00555 [Candidatus Saccharibacteria bacterium]|nr:hypothetical protein [Candidatus Saccharibacteria bacterium]
MKTFETVREVTRKPGAIARGLGIFMLATGAYSVYSAPDRIAEARETEPCEQAPVEQCLTNPEAYEREKHSEENLPYQALIAVAYGSTSFIIGEGIERRSMQKAQEAAELQ